MTLLNEMKDRKCPNCNHMDTCGHYVPPSFGDEGFYACNSICTQCIREGKGDIPTSARDFHHQSGLAIPLYAVLDASGHGCVPTPEDILSAVYKLMEAYAAYRLARKAEESEKTEEKENSK